MTSVKVDKKNIDNVTDLWLPDKELCSAQDELRRIEEWKRSAGGTKRPSELGINGYMYGFPLHEKFYEGRNPPPVALDSAENLEWYAEQLHRCIYGFEYKGQRITGDHYWMLNFTPFLVMLKDEQGKPTGERDIDFGYFAYQHDYIYKLVEEAHWEGLKFMLMGGRGFGKTYIILSILAKQYYLKPHSLSFVSASNSKHAGEAFDKLKDMLTAIDHAHPTLALARLTDTRYSIKSGYEINKDGVKMQEGPMSKLQCVIYGDNPGITRGSRPHAQLLEEVGDWATGKGDLKSCIGASEGSWAIGAEKTCRVFMVGTGGSIASDQAKDIFLNPGAYDVLAVNDFTKETNKKHCVFIPSHYMLGGMGWERTGVNNNEASEAYLLKRREAAKDDIEIFDKRVQEYPMTISETFKKSGTNIFNQRKISKQWADLQYGKDTVIIPEKGFLDWKRSKAGKIVGVEWAKNPNGNIEIVEHPYRGESGNQVYSDLYVAGVDGIDQGILDSTAIKGRSSMACLIKKRIVDGGYFKHTSNMYVAKYLGRSLDVRDDYEEVLKLSMYYYAKVNLEYTKIGIAQYFREKKQYHRLMKRPLIAMPSGGSGDMKYLGIDSTSHLIGTTTASHVIDHQDGKIKEYVSEYCHSIFFMDLLEQLRDYQREDRRKYDLVVAMGLCEIADEDMLGIPAQSEEKETGELKTFGYYVDEKGHRRMGVIPVKRTIENTIKTGASTHRWVDSSGIPRFDDRYDIADARDLED